MATVDVDIEALEKHTKELGNLLKKLDGVKTQIPGVDGGGKTYAALYTLAEDTGRVKNTMGMLIQNSIEFFEKAKSDFESADRASADALSGK